MKIMTKILLVWFSYLVFLSIQSKCSENSLLVIDQKSDDNDVSVEEFNSDEEIQSLSDPFIPTEEWKPIHKGQIIPAGLHVRINLETGLKEAKILDQNNEEVDKNVKLIDRHKKVTQLKSGDESKLLSIKEILKNMKFNENFNEMSDGLNDSETSFRSIDEIKKEFNQINLKMRSESEVLKELLERYNNSLIDEKLSLLLDIEYLVHSIDTAQDFVKLYGIDSLLPDINSTDSRLRAQVAFTLGSAMNANPKVQIEGLKWGALKHFLLLLKSDSSFDVKKKCLFAISSLVRQFPSAQKSLIKEYGGLSIFAQFFKQSDINSIKLSAKVVTLLNDLSVERELTSKYAANDELSQIKLKQYQEIKFDENVIEEGFCQLIPGLLNSGDNEVIEKTIEAMNSFSNICSNDFKKSLSLLQKVCDNFEILSKSEINQDSNDFYFTNLFKLSLNLINKLNSDSKDEF